MKKTVSDEKRFIAIATVILVVISIVALFPMILLVVASFTDENELITNGYQILPKKLSLEAYTYMVKQAATIVRSYLVTIGTTVVGTGLSVLLTTSIAYPMARKTFKYRNALSFFVYFTMLFNGGLVPTYINYTTVFHVKDTFFGLLVPSLMMSALNVLLMKSYFVTGVPDEILEAAYIDGANEFQTMWKIAIPLSKPIITTVAMFSGIAYWNDWNNGYIYLTKRTDLYSIQNLLNQMITDIQYLASGKVTGNIGAEVAKLPTTSIRMAIAFIAMLPLFIIYPFLQKYFAEGITLGAVKG